MAAGNRLPLGFTTRLGARGRPRYVCVDEEGSSTQHMAGKKEFNRARLPREVGSQPGRRRWDRRLVDYE